MKSLGKTKRTNRGFEIIEFKDKYGVVCSLQQSSLAERAKPGTSAIWLGPVEANPRLLLFGQGYQPFLIPEGVQMDTRAHLDRKQVKALIEHLQSWLDRGTFKIGGPK